MQAILQNQSNLLNRYNLFSLQPPPTKIIRTPKQPKPEIKIIFQHPNLLYLSNKRVKTKEELSEEIQRKLLGIIKNRRKNNSQNKPRARPTRSDFSYSQYKSYDSLKDQPLRCKTSAGSWGRNPHRRNLQLQAQFDVHSFEEDSGKSDVLEANKIDLQNHYKDKSLNRSSRKKTQANSENALNKNFQLQQQNNQIKHQKNKDQDSEIVLIKYSSLFRDVRSDQSLLISPIDLKREY